MTAQVLASTLVLLLVTGRALAIARLRAVDRAVEGAMAPAAGAVEGAMARVALRAAMAVFIPARPSAVEPAMDGAAENVPRFAVAAFDGGPKWRKANSVTAENSSSWGRRTTRRSMTTTGPCSSSSCRPPSQRKIFTT